MSATACERFGHAWYAIRFGGIGCGRPGCHERRSEFCMVAGKPSPTDEHEHTQPADSTNGAS